MKGLIIFTYGNIHEDFSRKMEGEKARARGMGVQMELGDPHNEITTCGGDHAPHCSMPGDLLRVSYATGVSAGLQA